MRDVMGRWGALAAALLWLAGCGGSAGSGPAPLTVGGTEPAADATGVTVHGDLTVAFKTDLDPATVTSSALSVVNGAGATVNGTASLVGTKGILFKPDAPLAGGSRHTATLAPSLKDKAGATLTGGFDWSFTTAPAPAAPSGLSVSLLPTFPPGLIWDVGQVPLEVRWQDQSTGEAGFAVERNAGGGWVEVARTLPNLTVWLDPDGLVCGSYEYRVRALGLAGGDSAPSAPASFAAPNRDLSMWRGAVVGDTYDLWVQDFDAYFNATPSVYTFEEADDPTFSNVLRTFTVAYPGDYQFATSITKLAGTVGRFCYRAHTDTVPCWSATPFCVAVNTADGAAPSTPTGLTAAAASGTSVALAWQPSIDNRGVAGYLVFRDGVQVGRVDYALTYEDGGLTSGSYCYTLTAFDLTGNQSAQSAEACATLPDVTPPSAPTGVYAAYYYNYLLSGVTDLTWAAAADDVGVAEYRIRRCGYVFGPCTEYGYWKSTTETSEMAIWEGMLNYCYVVTAVDAAGNESPRSDQACDVSQ